MRQSSTEVYCSPREKRRAEPKRSQPIPGKLGGNCRASHHASCYALSCNCACHARVNSNKNPGKSAAAATDEFRLMI